MNLESLQSDWALWAALVALLFAVLAIIPKLLQRTSRSKLNRVFADVKAARKELRKATRAAKKAEKKYDKLLVRADRVKPRVLQEAKEGVEDAKALAKILNDKVIVAETHVRRIIYDEFPPEKHEGMRAKYLPQDIIDNRPFSF
jgi:hypothetical protein